MDKGKDRDPEALSDLLMETAAPPPVKQAADGLMD